MKLFTIGDSISQGFMSGSAAKPRLAYSSLIAECLGLRLSSMSGGGAGYFYPEWKAFGLPASLEDILRALCARCGSSIGLLEWPAVLKTINDMMDVSEDYFERGEGAADNPYPGDVPFFHNVAIRDFTVADAWLLTPKVCRERIEAEGFFSRLDGFFANPGAYFYRTALKVLSPNLDCDFSQLDWLGHHAKGEGVENLILWLGANNALKTVLTLKIKKTPNTPLGRPCGLSHLERAEKEWNLWHPDDFAAEYGELLDRVETALADNRFKSWNVFVATVPFVTALPFIHGLGQGISFPEKGIYYRDYTYFPFDEKFISDGGAALSRQDVMLIDDCVRGYNLEIQRLVDEKNRAHLRRSGRAPYHIVDLCAAFDRMAWQRNSGNPTTAFPDCFAQASPKISTAYYHADEANGRLRGGIFSLDGIHPSAIGQGLIAREFMKVMEAGAGLAFCRPLDWTAILKRDSLYQDPITIMPELYCHEKLATHIVKLISFIKA
jgi:hypothetical protein